MPWPVTRFYTFVPNSAPAYDDVWGNNVETAINGVYAGTKSLVSTTIDGVGGQTQSPAAAQLVVGQSALADTALQVWKDQGGHVRGMVDHLGYKRGRFFELREDWLSWVTVNTATSGKQGRWNYSCPTNGAIITTNPNGGLGRGLKLGANGSTGIASGNTVSINTDIFVDVQSFHSIVMELEVLGPASPGSDHMDVMVGLHDATGISASTAPNSVLVALLKRDADTVWQLCTKNGVTPTIVPTSAGISSAPAADRITLEFHQSASPYGLMARLSVNETTVVTSATNIGSAPLQMSAFVAATTSGGTSLIGSGITISALRVYVNNQLSLPSI